MNALRFARGLAGGWVETRRHRRAGYWADRTALVAWQAPRVVQHLQWVAARAPFYRDRLGASPTLESWRAMVPIEKAELLEHFDRAVTVPLTRQRAYEVAQAAYRSRDFDETIDGLTVGLSSGTTGAPGLFVADAWERGRWAGTALACALPMPRRLPLRIALALRANSTLYESLNVGLVRFSYVDLHAQRAAQVAQLARVSPDILVGPPSVLADLVDGGLRIAPQRVISVAESLAPDVRARLRDAFGCDIMQLYQATEGFIAAPCHAGGLHVNEDALVMDREYLDEASGRFVPVITDFTRRSQPIIRYRLTDVLIESRVACACGSPLLSLERIEGRLDDVWHLAAANAGATVSIFPDQVSLAIGSVVGPALRDFVATRTSPTTAHVMVEWADGTDAPAHAAAIASALVALAQRRGAVPITVVVESGRIARSDRKHRRVVGAPVVAHG